MLAFCPLDSLGFNRRRSDSGLEPPAGEFLRDIGRPERLPVAAAVAVRRRGVGLKPSHPYGKSLQVGDSSQGRLQDIG